MNSTSNDKSIFDRLMDVLDQVKADLKKGNIESLSRHSAEQTRLVEMLEKHSAADVLTERQTRLLAQSAGQNQRLLLAAMAGIRSASRRKSDIRDAQKTTQTYDRSGQRSGLEPTSASLERRS